MRALQVGREVIAGESRVNGRRVEELVAEQAGQLQQLSRVVAQVAERKRVAQRMRRDGHACKTGTRVRRARRATLAMTACMVRTGIAVSRMLVNSAAVLPGAPR